MSSEMLFEEFDQDLFFKVLKNLPTITENISIVLLKTGWFIDFRNSPERYVDLAQKNEFEELDKAQIKYFEKNLKRIESLCNERFSNRKKLLSRAFTAHRRHDYSVAIIIFLTQIDGIFRDLSGKSIFSSKKWNGPVDWVDQLRAQGKSEILLAALSPLKKTELLSSNFDQIYQYPNNIHRNAILHGYDIDFGNELNSYKTISLMNYIVSIIFNIINNNTIIEKV
jgi:hypothetical protein